MTRLACALDDLTTARTAVVEVLAACKIIGPEYKAAEAALEAIDDLVGALTGDRELLWSRAPTMSGHEN